MALVISDRIKESSTTTGTGTLTLGGALTGFETFTANLSDGDTTYYCCTDNTDFEVGLGTFASSGTTLARTTILASSNSNNAVNWSSGTRTVFCTLPAAKTVFLDASGNTSVSGSVTAGSFVIGSADINENDLESIDGITAGTVAASKAAVVDTNKDITGFRNVTLTGELDAGSLDVSGDADIDGTTNLDIVDIDGAVSIDAATTIGTNNKIQFRDTALYINSSTDGQLDLVADTEIQIAATTIDINGNVLLSADLSVGDDLTIEGGLIDLKSNSGSASQIKFYCEVSNAHAQTLTAQPHSAAATNTLRLPDSGDSGTQDLVAVDTTQTLTNKSIVATQLTGTIANARLDADLQALAGLTSAADKGIQFTGSGSAATYDLTAAGKALLDDADAAAQRSTLGLGTASTLAVGVSNTNVAQFGSGIADNDFLKIDGTSVEGRSAAEVLSDIGGQASLTFGISNTNAVKIDHASVADDDFARFTANGLEGRSASETLSDIGGTSATDAANEATALAIALG